MSETTIDTTGATFDLDAARARRIETSGQPLHFTFGGEDFSILPVKEWDLEIPELMAQGEISTAFNMLLGDADYARFRAHKPTVGDFETLGEWLQTASTGGSGN